MKIELEIPDSYKNTNLTLMWGMVPIARWRWANQYWEMKTGFCSDCGKCCQNMTDKKRFVFAGDNGCIYRGEFNCSLGLFRPVGCSIADSPVDGCTVQWSRV